MHLNRRSGVLRTARGLPGRVAARLPGLGALSRFFANRPEKGGTAEPSPPSTPGSVLDVTGPVPAELLAASAPEDPVPWSIRLAETERGWARRVTIWRAAAVVSWAVTAVAVLRGLGVV